MTELTNKLASPCLHSFQFDLSCQPVRRWVNEVLDVAIRMLFVALVLAAVVMSFSVRAKSQSQIVTSESTTNGDACTPSTTIDFNSTPPTERSKINNYLFDAFGPYPVMGAVISAGINQWSNAPPEWGQRFSGYSKRFGSDYGMLAVGTTTRYALSAALKEDSLYYRCACTRTFTRFDHAVLSTWTARRGTSGHRVFSLPALVAPYVGSMTAVYAWYPDRFGAKDALRIGNYNMLVYMSGNVMLEFFYSKPHSLLSRMHLNNLHGSTMQGPNQ